MADDSAARGGSGQGRPSYQTFRFLSSLKAGSGWIAQVLRAVCAVERKVRARK
jgi:hypothetical protein